MPYAGGLLQATCTMLSIFTIRQANSAGLQIIDLVFRLESFGQIGVLSSMF
jgi:hypothetical protein